ncbi:cupin [candidate division BRC1 bacterium SM23_51]|nr:MAG: cupin [candidate division BRC1 bacterium SM23_51]
MEITVRKPTEEELDQMAVRTWPTWECDPSEFDWQYDETETCYILEGDVTVKTDTGDVHFAAGDLVVFPKGLKCVWSVAQKVRKHYRFG